MAKIWQKGYYIASAGTNTTNVFQKFSSSHLIHRVQSLGIAESKSSLRRAELSCLSSLPSCLDGKREGVSS